MQNLIRYKNRFSFRCINHNKHSTSRHLFYTTNNLSTLNRSGGSIHQKVNLSTSSSNDAKNEEVVVKEKKSRPVIYQTISDLAALSKFRLSSLVAFTTASGYMTIGAFSSLPFDWSVFSAACIGTVLCAASAGTFNQVFEIDQDKSMKRTCQRPLPTGRITINTAVTFGAATGVAGVNLLYFFTNPMVAALGLANIILYAGPYTFSKRVSEWNTWLGAVVGAIPPVMGYAAASGGSILAVEPAVLSGLLFLWQFPHFFALSWMYRLDYATGGFQMVSVNDMTGSRTASLIQEYSIYLTALPIFTSLIGYTTYMFCVEGTAANLYLLYLSHRFKQDRSNANARRVFLCSLWYLPVLICGYVFHHKSTTNDLQENVSVDFHNHIVSVTATETTSDSDSEKNNGILQYFTLLRSYLRDRCVHEIIVDNNKEKASNHQQMLQPHQEIIISSQHDKEMLNSDSSANNTDSNVKSSNINNENDLKKENKNVLKNIVLHTPGVETLSSQLCFKIKSEESAALVTEASVNAVTGDATTTISKGKS